MRSPKQALEITIGKGVGAAMAVSAFGLITGIYAASPGTSAAQKLVHHEAAGATVHDGAIVDVSEAASARFIRAPLISVFVHDRFYFLDYAAHSGVEPVETSPIAQED
jgi:hypothetical protein